MRHPPGNLTFRMFYKEPKLHFASKGQDFPPEIQQWQLTFCIQHTNRENHSLAFLKRLQFTITLLLITNRYWFSYSQNDWRLCRSDFQGSQRSLNPAIYHPGWIPSFSVSLCFSSSLDIQLFCLNGFQLQPGYPAILSQCVLGPVWMYILFYCFTPA